MFSVSKLCPFISELDISVYKFHAFYWQILMKRICRCGTIPLHSPWRGPSLSLRPGFRAVRSLVDQELF